MPSLKFHLESPIFGIVSLLEVTRILDHKSSTIFFSNFTIWNANLPQNFVVERSATIYTVCLDKTVLVFILLFYFSRHLTF